jgi:hypothetical protein
VARFNYQDDMFYRAPGTEQNLTIEGGNDQTRYYLSGNFANEDGILRSTSSRRSGARINLQQQLTSRLLGNVTANYVTTQNQVQAFGEQNDYGIMGSLFFAPTNVDFRPVNGIYPLPPALGTNPLLAIDRIRNPQTIDRFIGSTKLTWTPFTNLLADYTIGVDNIDFEQRQFIPRGAVLGTAPLATGRSQSVFQSTLVVNQDAVATYTWKPMGKFELRTTGGANYTSQRVRTTQAVANGLAPVGDLVSAGSVFSAAQLDVELRTLGFYGQQEIGWADKLFLTGAVRYDASSTFAPSERWQAFPKFSASYVVIPNQPGMLNNLRVRGALGWAGSQPGIVNAYSQFISYTQLPFAGRPGFVNDVTYGNPSLRNERAREWELGTSSASLAVALASRRRTTIALSRTCCFSARSRRARVLAPVLPDRLDVEQGHRAGIEHDESRAAELLVDVDGDIHAQQESRRAARHPGLPVGGRLPEPDPRRLSGGSFYGSYAARDCRTGQFLLDSLGRYRRSNQTVDLGATRRSGKRSAAARATTRSTRSSATRTRSGWDRCSTK